MLSEILWLFPEGSLITYDVCWFVCSLSCISLLPGVDPILFGVIGAKSCSFMVYDLLRTCIILYALVCTFLKSFLSFCI